MKTRLALVLPLALGLAISWALPGLAGTIEVVVASPKPELGPTASETFVAWFVPGKDGRSNVWAQETGSDEPFRLNPPDTVAYTGGIDGSTFVYEQGASGSKPDLVFVDLSTRSPLDPPDGINTPRAEFAPSMSGDLILFGRGIRGGVSVVLFDTSSGTSSVLYSKTNTEHRFFTVIPTQVNGNYAVWEQLVFDKKGDLVAGGVYRYDIAAATTTPIAHDEGEWLYGPSVSTDGTVYFGRSGLACGHGAQLVSQALDGSETVLYDVPKSDDFGFSWALDRSDGTTDVYFDPGSCTGSDFGDIVKLNV